MEKETKNCQNCKKNFQIESEDFEFYKKIDVPPPTWCPECRIVRRFAWRNEHSLYKRACDLCKKEKILMYHAQSPYKVYCYQCWWGDSWDPRSYAKDYDFNRPFFEQFNELLQAVPRPGVIKQGNSVESEYTNRVTDMRNCYLVFGSIGSEFSRYSTWINQSKECLDCYSTQKSERCYECVDCMQCYNVAFSQESNNCTDSWFLFNCNNCQNCFGCVNLRNKQYCIFNEQYSKEDYEKIVSGYALGSNMFFEGLDKKFQEFKKKFIIPSLVTHHSDNVSGNWIEGSKNALRSFSCWNTQEVKYCLTLVDAKDSMDYSYWGANSERAYEVINSGIQCADIQFASDCWEQAINIRYSTNCHSSESLFGCVGLRKAQYCILNKQYEKEEYLAMVQKIKDQMSVLPYKDKADRSYSYGEFFPPELSPFGYNETIAHDFFPLSKEEASAHHYSWREGESRNYVPTLKVTQLTDNSSQATSSIANEIIACAHEGKCKQQCAGVFRILSEDLEFYKKNRLPLPMLCPNCRHHERLKRRTPFRLRKAQCNCLGDKSENNLYTNTGTHFHGKDRCLNEFETAHLIDQFHIYCVECYNAEVA